MPKSTWNRLLKFKVKATYVTSLCTLQSIKGPNGINININICINQSINQSIDWTWLDLEQRPWTERIQSNRIEWKNRTEQKWYWYWSIAIRQDRYKRLKIFVHYGDSIPGSLPHCDVNCLSCERQTIDALQLAGIEDVITMQPRYVDSVDWFRSRSAQRKQPTSPSSSNFGFGWLF